MGGQHSNLVHNVGYIVPNTATENSSDIIRNSQFKDAIIDLPIQDEPNINTCWAVSDRAFNIFGDRPMFGTRVIKPDGTAGKYQWESYEAVGKEVTAIGSAMAKRGISKKPVSVFGKNTASWLKALCAIWRQGNICVPLYDTLGADSTKFILGDAEVTTIFCAAEKTSQLLEIAQEVGITLLIQFEPVGDEALSKVPEGVELISLEDFMKESDEVVPAENPTREDLAYIMYTSGTTGNPKGVKLSHKNVLASVAGLRVHGAEILPDDVYFSYLPLAHILETCLVILGVVSGASVGFYQGNVKKLTEDIVELKPTVFAGVPRVYSRIYDVVMQKVESSGWLKKSLFESAFKNQLENVMNGTRNSFWDKLVFDKTKLALGGRIRLMASGAAPLPGYLQDFLRVVFQCEVLQGYGMTENAAAAAVSPLGFLRSGTIGEPIACCEIKLVDVPELNYFHTDEKPRGELCIRGANVFQGYHNLPDKTAEALEDGWLHTGDIGQLNEDGSLQIIDRKKNIFKLAQGEYVAAEECENIFKKSKFISQIFVYGDSFHTTLVAVIVPDKESITPWMQANNITGSFKESLMDKRVSELMLAEMKQEGKAAKLAGFKIPRHVIIENEINEMNQGFSVENNCLTPTFKLRRPQLKARYIEQFDAIYENEQVFGVYTIL